MRFKQICNHPSQWLGDAAYAPDDSGKFQRLAELGVEIESRIAATAKSPPPGKRAPVAKRKAVVKKKPAPKTGTKKPGRKQS